MGATSCQPQHDFGAASQAPDKQDAFFQELGKLVSVAEHHSKPS